MNSTRATLLTVVLLLLALGTLFIANYGMPQGEVSPAVSNENVGPAPPASNFQPHRTDVSGNEHPEFVAPRVVQLAPHDEVIGVIVDGKPRAYVKRALSKRPEKHVVSDFTPQGRITVTYCDLEACTRVFVDSGQQEPIRVGGRRPDRSLELIVDGQRHSQLSDLIPRDKFPFEEATWQEWFSRHPETSVYIGGDRGG